MLFFVHVYISTKNRKYKNWKHKIIKDKQIGCYFTKIELKVLNDKEANLLTDLLQDIKEMSVEFRLQKPPRRLIHTYQLKKILQLRFGHNNWISSFGNCNAVHSINLDPLLYSHGTIKWHGSREYDIVKVFANLVRRKLDDTNLMKWAQKAKDSIKFLEISKPLACIYNDIILFTNPRNTKNKNGYADTNNHDQAEKMTAITQSWEKFDFKEKFTNSYDITFNITSNYRQ